MAIVYKSYMSSIRKVNFDSCIPTIYEQTLSVNVYSKNTSNGFSKCISLYIYTEDARRRINAEN